MRRACKALVVQAPALQPHGSIEPLLLQPLLTSCSHIKLSTSRCLVYTAVGSGIDSQDTAEAVGEARVQHLCRPGRIPLSLPSGSLDGLQSQPCGPLTVQLPSLLGLLGITDKVNSLQQSRPMGPPSVLQTVSSRPGTAHEWHTRTQLRYMHSSTGSGGLASDTQHDALASGVSSAQPPFHSRPLLGSVHSASGSSSGSSRTSSSSSGRPPAGFRYGLGPPSTGRGYMVGDDRKIYTPPSSAPLAGSLSVEEIAYKTRNDIKFQVIVVKREQDSYVAQQPTQFTSARELGIHSRDASLFASDGKSAPQRATITVREEGSGSKILFRTEGMRAIVKADQVILFQDREETDPRLLLLPLLQMLEQQQRMPLEVTVLELLLFATARYFDRQKAHLALMLDLMRSDSQLALKHKPFRIHSESRDSDIFMSQGTDLAGTDGPAHSSASSMNGSVQQQMANLHAKMMKRRSHKKRGFIRTMVDRAKRVFSKDTYFEVFDNLSEAAITQFVPFEKVLNSVTNDAKETCQAINKIIEDDELLESLLVSLRPELEVMPQTARTGSRLVTGAVPAAAAVGLAGQQLVGQQQLSSQSLVVAAAALAQAAAALSALAGSPPAPLTQLAALQQHLATLDSTAQTHGSQHPDAHAGASDTGTSPTGQQGGSSNSRTGSRSAGGIGGAGGVGGAGSSYAWEAGGDSAWHGSARGVDCQYIGAHPPGSLRDVIRDEALEALSRIFETYAREMESITGTLVEMQDNLDSMREAYRMKLDAKRNEIIQVNLWYSMVSVSAVAATLPPAFFGMNIEHGLEQHIGWFYGICTFSLLFGMLSYPLLTAWIAHVLGRRSAESVFQLNQLKLFLATHLRDLDMIVDAIQKIRPHAGDAKLDRRTFTKLLRKELTPHNIRLTTENCRFLFDVIDTNKDGFFEATESIRRKRQNLPEVPGAAHGMHATHPSAYTAPVNSPSYTATSATTAAAAAGTAAASLAAAAAGAHLGNGSVIGGSGGGGGGSGGTPLGPATLQAARTPALHAESFAGGNELDSEGEEDDEEESEGDEELTNDDLPGK